MGSPRAKTTGRTASGRFAPGQSGNPGGRTRGVAARIRELTDDGDEMIRHFVATMRGEVCGAAGKDANGEVKIEPATVRDRTDAAKWLGDRVWGKAPERIEISEVEKKAAAFADMTRDELLAAIRAAVNPEPEEG